MGLIFQPEIFDRFKCDPYLCDDSCCQQWNIHLDRITALEYQHSKDQEIKEIACRSIIDIENQTEESHSRIILDQDGQCAFLMKNRLCLIQNKIGENHLSRTCKTYPRVIHTDGSLLLRSMDLSCPLVARAVTNIGSRSIQFIELPATQQDMYRLHDEFHVFHSAEPVMNFILDVIGKLKGSGNGIHYRLNDILIENGNRPLDLKSIYAFEVLNGLMALKFSGKTNITFHSRKFTPFLMDCLDVYGRLRKKPHDGYLKLKKEFLDPYLEKHPYLLENVVRTYISCHGAAVLQKATDNDSSDLMLRCAIQIGLLEFLLTGVAKSRGGLEDDIVFDLVQSFSKTFNQDEEYWNNALEKLKGERL